MPRVLPVGLRKAYGLEKAQYGIAADKGQEDLWERQADGIRTRKAFGEGKNGGENQRENHLGQSGDMTARFLRIRANVILGRADLH